jgi:hypothetical protein
MALCQWPQVKKSAEKSIFLRFGTGFSLPYEKIALYYCHDKIFTGEKIL